MTKLKTQVVKKNVSMYPREWQIVERVKQRYSLSTAAALRHIVNQWQELQDQLPQPIVLES